MSELIGGKEALIALANGEEVIFVSKGYEVYGDDFWSTPSMTKNFSIYDFMSGKWVFKLYKSKKSS